MKRLFIYLPCYNEAGNICTLIHDWMAEKDKLASEGYELYILPIDDKSTDNTKEIITELGNEISCVIPIFHQTNRNLGGVVNTAIDDFLQRSQKDDIMGLMDGDNTHKPRFVHSMLDKLSDTTTQHCVIASRYQHGAEIHGLQKSREWFSIFARIYYTAILHVPKVRDYTCGYRLYTKKALTKAKSVYREKLIENRSFACMMELLYKLHRTGCSFDEVPFTLYYDCKEGESKMNLKKTIKDSLLSALQLRFQNKL